VAEFTTPHPCCAPRVTNIHRIADMVRGTLVGPGETFSLNGITGPRTAAKGFVSAPAIIDGEYVDDVGGGVSQFATTAFNAAFFAGVDITEYQMHSEYISRYPYAREATVFYPGVDLKFRNDTPYGIVVWPTYTGTSVTVQLWSTPYARGEQTGQSQSSGCGSVTTTRTITYPDRPTATDTFRANYRCV
jgi:vancomycin resistance protein YoaR